jgi:hypothetical protein|nr:MAG TPA: Dec protein, OB-Fold, Decoration, VIRAL PROTEIN [Caudoviricetes sp.]
MANRSDGIKPFRFWCQKVLPLVYDDSLSYYETLCRVVDKLNEVIENSGTAYVDEQIEALRKELIDLIQQTSAADREYTDQEVAKAKEELGQKITELESSLTEKINQLESETNEKFEAVNDDITEVKGDITNIQGDITEINQNIENIIDGTTPVPSGHAETADKLKTARELTVDLTSNTPASFDGSANATIGVIPGGNAGDVLTSKGEGAPPAWEPPTGGGGGPSDTAKRLDPGANIQVSLASTDPALFTGASNVYPGVEGILATKNGGTGNNFTAEEYAGSLWFDQAQKVIKNAPFGEENTVLTSTGTASAPKWAPLPPGIETPVSVENGGTGKNIASLDRQGIVFYRKDTGFQVDNGSVAGNILHSAGDGEIPTWGNVSLESEVGGTLKTVNGGTGMASVPQYEIPYGDLSNPMKTTELSDDTPSVLMRQGTAFAPMWEPFNPSDPLGNVVVPTKQGGTGIDLDSDTNWGVTYYNATKKQILKRPMAAAGTVLTSNGTTSAPSWQTLNAGKITDGILSPLNGGTGTAYSGTNWGVLYWSGADKKFLWTSMNQAGYVLTSNGPNKAPTFQAPAGGGGEFKELSLSLDSNFTGSSKVSTLKLLTNHKGLVLIECTVQNGFDLQITKNQFTLGKATSADADFRGNCSYVTPTVTGTGILIGSTGNSLDGIKVSCNYGEGDKKPFVICTLMNDPIITEKRSYSALLISCSNNYEQIL